MKFPQPRIPLTLLHAMEQITVEKHFDQDNGGQWTAVKERRVRFRGVVLPLSNEDLQYAPPGTFTKDSRELYTNGFRLAVGAQVYDPVDGVTYTVKNENTHGPVHPLKTYIVERKGASNPK